MLFHVEHTVHSFEVEKLLIPYEAAILVLSTTVSWHLYNKTD